MSIPSLARISTIWDGVASSKWRCKDINLSLSHKVLVAFCYSRKTVGFMHRLSQEHPGIVRVSWESWDTPTVGSMVPGTSCDHLNFLEFLGQPDIGVLPQVVPGTSWDCPSILGFPDSGVHTHMVPGTSCKYFGIPGTLRHRCPCTGGPRNILGSSNYLGILRQ